MITPDLTNPAEPVAALSSEPASGKMLDAARQLLASATRYVQENQKNYETLSRLMDRPSDKLWDHDRQIADLRRYAETNRELIRSYRN